MFDDDCFAFDTAARKKSFASTPFVLSSFLFFLVEQSLIASFNWPTDRRHLTALVVAPQPNRITVACEISCRAVDGLHIVDAV